jgi:hypothetical protein
MGPMRLRWLIHRPKRQTPNAERQAQTRLTQMVNRILYRLAGLVLELVSSASLFTTVVYPP